MLQSVYVSAIGNHQFPASDIPSLKTEQPGTINVATGDSVMDANLVEIT